MYEILSTHAIFHSNDIQWSRKEIERNAKEDSIDPITKFPTVEDLFILRWKWWPSGLVIVKNFIKVGSIRDRSRIFIKYISRPLPKALSWSIVCSATTTSIIVCSAVFIFLSRGVCGKFLYQKLYIRAKPGLNLWVIYGSSKLFFDNLRCGECFWRQSIQQRTGHVSPKVHPNIFLLLLEKTVLFGRFVEIL